MGTRRTARKKSPVSGIGAVIVGLIVVGIGVLYYLDARNPVILLDAHSEAVTFRTDTVIDLVARAGLGLRPGELESAGIAFDSVWIDSAGFQSDTAEIQSPGPATSDERRSAARGPKGEDSVQGDSVPQDLSQFLRRLAVTEGCDVHLERYAHSVTRLGFAAPRQRANPSRSACRVRGRLFVSPDSSRPTTALEVRFDAELDGQTPASLYVKRSQTFTLRDLPVGGLRFEESHAEDAIESSILGGWIRIPEPREREERLYFRDRLRLGQLSQGALRITVGDSIRAFFRGKSSDPWLGRGQGEGESLVPSLLQALYHNEDIRVGASLAGGFATALGGLMRILRP